MDITRILAELRLERTRTEEAILTRTSRGWRAKAARASVSLDGKVKDEQSQSGAAVGHPAAEQKRV